ncbi:MAG: hypothetical protein ACRD4F_10435, partial [Candidatus Angelobacter sp.]
VTLVWAVLLFTAFHSTAQAEVRGKLTVTAVVQSSATWLRGGDGNWRLVIANAPDSNDTFSGVAANAQQQQAGEGRTDRGAGKNKAKIKLKLAAGHALAILKGNNQ